MPEAQRPMNLATEAPSSLSRSPHGCLLPQTQRRFNGVPLVGFLYTGSQPSQNTMHARLLSR